MAVSMADSMAVGTGGRTAALKAASKVFLTAVLKVVLTAELMVTWKASSTVDLRVFEKAVHWAAWKDDERAETRAENSAALRAASSAF